MRSITVETESAVTLVVKCLHCGKLFSHAMQHKPQEFDQQFQMMGVVAFPDATAFNCDNCGNKSIVTFARPVDAEVERLRAVLRDIERTLTIPAAEYVPAIGDVFTLIDKARGHAGTQSERTATEIPNGEGVPAAPVDPK